MASCMGIEVYKDTTSRMHGHNNALLVVRSMSLRLFFRCAEMFSNIGLRALESSHEMRWVGPLMFDTMGRILISGPVLWVLMRW